MFVFWHRFVQPNSSLILKGFGSAVCGEIFAEQLNSHVGRAFEECAKQYMWRAMKETPQPFFFKKIGRWWGNNPKERREEEIDFIAFAGENAVFGECKWSSRKVGVDVLENLVRKSKLHKNFSNTQYIWFSKSGFTDGLKKTAAEKGGVFLVSVDDMFFPV
jgi:hypothetical protein